VLGTIGSLVADSAETTGLKWASPTTTTNYTLLNSGGTSLTGGTVTVSSLSGYNKLFVLVTDFSFAGATAFDVTFNSDTGSNYYPAGLKITANNVYNSTTTFTGRFGSTDTKLVVGVPYGAANVGGLAIWIDGCNSSGQKIFSSTIGYQGFEGNEYFVVQGRWDNSAVLSSVSFIGRTQNFDAGTVRIYGAN
jgi:hypothetical protein